jgi:hypothetical protein
MQEGCCPALSKNRYVSFKFMPGEFQVQVLRATIHKSGVKTEFFVSFFDSVATGHFHRSGL